MSNPYPDGHLKSVLIVEDDPVCTALYRQCLQDLTPKLQIFEATHGYDALAELATLKPDLMILDLQMPSFGGLELLSLLAGKAAYSDLPVIVVSSAPDAADRIVERLPNAHVFLKPIRPALLQKVVSEILHLAIRHDPHSTDTYTGNARRFARVIAAQFYDLLPERLAQLEHYISRNDVQRLHEWCHAMQGTAAVIGANVLLDQIRALQDALDRADSPQYGVAGERITHEARRFAVALDQAFGLSGVDIER